MVIKRGFIKAHHNKCIKYTWHTQKCYPNTNTYYTSKMLTFREMLSFD